MRRLVHARPRCGRKGRLAPAAAQPPISMAMVMRRSGPHHWPSHHWPCAGLKRTYHTDDKEVSSSPPPVSHGEPRAGQGASAAGAGVQGLSAACVAGTAEGLCLEAQLFSPALGLILLQANAFVANLLRSAPPSSPQSLGPRWGPCFQLARELFFQRDRADPPQPTRSRSKPAFYLTPARLGHLVGLAVSTDRQPFADLEHMLRSIGITARTTRHGYRCDVDGVETNVSLARFLRLFRLVQEALADPTHRGSSPVLPLLLRYLWQTARGKGDLLVFLDTLHSYTPVFASDGAWDGLAEDEGLRKVWLHAQLDRQDIGDPVSAEAAASRLASLVTSPCSSPFPLTTIRDPFATTATPRDVEIVAACLSSAHAFKPAVRLRRHPYRGGPPKPDCVEVVVREIVDLLLFDPATSCFDVTRLPPSANQALRAFYMQEAAESTEEVEATRSLQWFELCCALPGVGYTATSPNNGVPDYELAPSLATVSLALGQLLFGPTGADGLGKSSEPPTSRRLADFARDWDCWRRPHGADRAGGSAAREHAQPPLLLVTERAQGHRPPASEETVWREVASLRFEGGTHHPPAPPACLLAFTCQPCSTYLMHTTADHHCLEVELEVLHNLAIARHTRDEVPWAKRPQDMLLQAWLKTSKPLPALFLASLPIPLRSAGVMNAHVAVAGPAAVVLRLSLLGDGMLRELDARSTLPPWEGLVEAVLCARWGGDGKPLSTIEASFWVGGVGAADAQWAEQEQLLRCLRCLSRLRGKGSAPVSQQVLRWMLDQVWPALPSPNPTPPMPVAAAMALGGALCDLPKADLDAVFQPLGARLQAQEAPVTGGSAIGGPSPAPATLLGSGFPLVWAVVRHGAFGDPLLKAGRGLGWGDTAALYYFATRRAATRYGSVRI